MYYESTEKETGFASLSDEALLMADEMMQKHYPLPEFINETTIRAAYHRAKRLEDYATDVML